MKLMKMLVLVLVVSLLHTVQAQELITLDSACGVLLQSSCPDLQKYVVGETGVWFCKLHKRRSSKNDKVVEVEIVLFCP